MTRRSAAISLLSMLALPGIAHARGTHDEQVWVNVTGMGGIGRHIVYFAEIQPRIGDGASDLNQLLLRPAIGVRLSPSLTVYQGYARVRTPVSGGTDTVEDRSFQQISWKIASPRGRGDFSSRTRIEQRWVSTGEDMGWRLREMIRLAVPLGQEQGRPRVAALAYAEGFFALNGTDWGARGGFDRLRAFVGAEVPVGGRSTVELGYLNQTVRQRMRPDTMDHVASVSVFLRR